MTPKQRAREDRKALRHAGRLLHGEAKVLWDSNVNFSGPNKGKLDAGPDADLHRELMDAANALFKIARRRPA